LMLSLALPSWILKLNIVKQTGDIGNEIIS